MAMPSVAESMTEIRRLGQQWRGFGLGQQWRGFALQNEQNVFSADKKEVKEEICSVFSHSYPLHF